MHILSKSTSVNIKQIQMLCADCKDLVFRSIYSKGLNKKKMTLVFIDGLCDKSFLSEYVVGSLKNYKYPFLFIKKPTHDKTIAYLASCGISAAQTECFNTFDELIQRLFLSDAVVLCDGINSFISISAKGTPKRAVSEPINKKTVRGPRDGFTESLSDNMALIQNRIKSPKLKSIPMVMGKYTNTPIRICYIEGIADEKLIKSVHDEISQVKLKSVLESGYVQNAIEGKLNTFFPKSEATERPDEACSSLLQGRIIAIFDNTPFVLIIPGLFRSMLCSTEDFYESSYKQKLFIALRICAMVLTAVLPALYIAITDCSPEFVSDKIIVFINSARQQIPFPVFFEILFVEFIFEIIIEAGLRLPTQLGFTVGIVGTIVLGQALVDANLVNLTVVIIVALTAILVFVIPNYSLALSIRILKFIFMFAAWVAGVFGIIITLIICLSSLCDIEYCGMEYMYPFVDSEISLKPVQREESTK